ncbi:MAG: ribosomal-protein-serine acetyltransferase [Flavobacteriaceae bacterium CG_4_9_14_0_8_um_filter_34_30]|nr:GNAT family N-acetyltransferase [Bacteroidota bacterium]PJC07727.1 MAG: ribosomal-protein-serine acetyltransferase [Flavobacteriaceae bacterium CG_4_9_14_0_8_um_filter_34_30]
MGFPDNYIALSKNKFTHDKFSIVPIRYNDRFDILKWRNEQMYHLRQNEELTIEGQEKYFNTVVSKLFDKLRPNQLLFSYLEGDKCIGYGGLVHINWIDKNAEISFLIDTETEKNHFEFHWNIYLKLIEQVAFKDLKLHKVYTYAFNIRPRLYKILEANTFINEAVLKEHCFYNKKFIDVIIHSKINN